MSDCIHSLYASHSPVFLVNSCLDLFSASPSLENPLSRSYGVILPSSLTTTHPSALVYSTRPRVSVWSTDARTLGFSGFSRRYGYPRYLSGPEPVEYCQVRIGAWICLRPSAPTPFNPVFRHRAEVSLPRPRVTCAASAGILTSSSIGIATRLILRFRLTPGRLTSPGNPWSYGEGESHPLYRYLYLHLLFRTLHRGSRLRLRRRPECSPTDPYGSRGFSAQLDTRLLSMPDPSTSELLRTL